MHFTEDLDNLIYSHFYTGRISTTVTAVKWVRIINYCGDYNMDANSRRLAERYVNEAQLHLQIRGQRAQEIE